MLAHERTGVTVHYRSHDLGGRHATVPHLDVPWETYFQLVDELIVAVADDATWRPNEIVAVTFGGAIPARALSQALGVPWLAYYDVERCPPGTTGKLHDAAHVLYARDLLKSHPGFGTDVLIVDDLIDEGVTIEGCHAFLRRHPEYGAGIRTMKTAVLWRKAHATAFTDFVVDHVVSLPIPGAGDETIMPWIDQPMDRAYSVPLDAIRTRAARRSHAT